MTQCYFSLVKRVEVQENLGADSLWPTQQVCSIPENNQLDLTKDHDETIKKNDLQNTKCTILVCNAQCFSILGYSGPKILDFWTLNVLILLLEINYQTKWHLQKQITLDLFSEPPPSNYI